MSGGDVDRSGVISRIVAGYENLHRIEVLRQVQGRFLYSLEIWIGIVHPYLTD